MPKRTSISFIRYSSLIEINQMPPVNAIILLKKCKHLSPPSSYKASLKNIRPTIVYYTFEKNAIPCRKTAELRIYSQWASMERTLLFGLRLRLGQSARCTMRPRPRDT